MNDEAGMTLALAEAVKGLGRTHPNPAVGAVLVKGSRLIATGFTAPVGGPHAEVEALRKAGSKAKGATLYVTLEPCSHHGRTPPCVEAIIKAGVRRVVFASTDPNPLVNGKGWSQLKAAGVSVTAHILRDAGDALIRPFLKAMHSGLPWVTAKAAITLDGKIATSTGRSKWISSEASRTVAHQLRNVVDVVVVGADTVIEDDPQLTTRLSRPGTRNPVRLVLDPRLRTSPRSAIYDTTVARTIVATLAPLDSAAAKRLIKRGVDVWRMTGTKGRIALVPLLKKLVAGGALHVLVEGGAKVHQSFLESGLVDEVVLFIAPKLFGHGGLTWSGPLAVKDPGRAPTFKSLHVSAVGHDVMLTALVR